MIRHACALVAITMLLAGCQQPFDRPSSPDPYISRAQLALGGRGFSFFHVASYGLLRDRQSIQQFRDGTSADPLPEQLATLLGQGAERELVVAVGGACGEKNRVVLEQALKRLAGRRLAHLELLFLGEARHGQALGEAVRALGAHFEWAEVASR